MIEQYSDTVLESVRHSGCSAASKKFGVSYDKLLKYCKQHNIHKINFNNASDLDDEVVSYIKKHCNRHKELLGKIQKDVNVEFGVNITNIKKVVDEIFWHGYADSYISQGVKRTCVACGKEFFTTSSRRKVCYDNHAFKCSVCGKDVMLTPEQTMKRLNSNSAFCCSETCRRKAISKSANEEKFKCKCKLCGKTFFSKNKNSKVCNDVHHSTCVVCGKTFELTYPYTRKTCSDKCQHKLASKTTKNEFGYENAFQIPQVREKAKRAVKEKYGADTYFSSQSGKDCLHEIWSDKEKVKLADEKRKQTFREKYGVDYGLQADEVKGKSKKTLMEKYGVDNIAKSASFYKHVNTEASDAQIDNLMSFKSNPEKFLDSLNFVPSLHDLSKLLGIRDSSVGQLLDKLNVPQNRINYVFSYMEQEVFDFLSSLNLDTEIVRNTRKVIVPLELDLYLPEYKFAIECNPTSTHNSSFGAWSSDDNPKSRSYHKQKTDLCEAKGIRLFHIFGYEWSHKRKIIESMVANALHATKNKIYARNTKVRDVSYTEATDFLNKNHRQGNTVNSIRLGLYYKNKLVSLMTFGKMRQTIGKSTNVESEYELSRFCSLLNTSVVGGASKLYRHFVNKYQPDAVTSFSDRAHTSGDLYKTLRFDEVRRSEPGYVWVRLKDDTAWSRVNAQKKNIVKFLRDDSVDLAKTEFEIMEEHKYAAVFDSGTITWVWRK